ncbi:uncharacterized protein B4U80_08417 [Leptotrombidium deliense]|uniref:Peptidase A2 domain-containing protein n=1 Tax=Leptotrombidium deliense TaxID=299467 RepID=A0A443RYD9_9ACAR|nr:uncharacterized protein B4U80_08417 [Leptotrombidium deliense]
MFVNGTEIKIVIDTGSRTNIIGEETVQQLKATKLKQKLKTNINLFAYFGQKYTSTHKVSLPVSHKDKHLNVDFMVVSGTNKTLLSGNTAEKLNLIKRVLKVNTNDEINHQVVEPPKKVTSNDIDKLSAVVTGDQILKNFKDVFTGMGKLPGKHRIEIDKSVPPVIMPVRRLPFAIRDQFKQELESMESEGLIDKVTKPTE